MGQKWTEAQRKKYSATRKRMAAEKKKGATSIPLDAIPDRPAKSAKKKVSVVVGNTALALDLLELAVKLLRASK